MMSFSNPTHAALLLLLIFLTASFKLCCCMRNSSIFCPEIEKRSLLTFKKSLDDPRHILSSWGGAEVNCCKWNGVVCNNSTGHVAELYLDHAYGLSGEINPSIGNLSNLQTLFLTSFGLRVHSLEWLSGLTKLEHLTMYGVDLAKADNLAKVINSLPSLTELSLTYCKLGPNLMAPPDEVNVTSLTLVDLSYNKIQSLPFLSWIFQFNELLYLDFSFNKIEGAIPTIRNATKLHYIDMSYNNFNSSIPDSLYLCRDMEYVDLSTNQLQGTVSNAIANLTSLAILNLSENKLSGEIPKEISYLCKIKELGLSSNELRGEITDSFGNMSGCILESLWLYDNQLCGSIPSSLGMLSSLRILWLHKNNFTGNLPESLGELLNLIYLDISDNKLEGVVSEANFKNLGNLIYLSASGNHLSLRVSPDWIPPFQLNILRLGSWDLGSLTIPSWLDTQKLSIQGLDLSITGISGSVPEWIWGIQSLNLSHNNLHGQIPTLQGGSVCLSSNQFNGSLPRITDNVGALDLSNNSFSGGLTHFLCDNTYHDYPVEFLHLGKNQLSGGLPGDCLNKWPDLEYLNLGDNIMSESIPDSIGFLTELRSLNLYGNKFSGSIPFSLRNCTKLIKIDFSHNDLHGNMPSWIGEMDLLKFLIFHSNSFDGLIPVEICRLNSLRILDLSDNIFSGIIPACVHNFTAMATTELSLLAFEYYSWMKESASVATKGFIMQYDTILPLVTNIDLSNNNLSGVIPKGLTSLVELKSLNLSQNHLTGSIPEKIGDMKQLESLDFTNNFLSGPIPSSIVLITYLSYLNLSCNRLTGRIPQGTQLQIMHASAFIGNDLCGTPLTSNCSSDTGDEIPSRGKEDDEGKNRIEWIYVLMSLGYAVGFSAVCTALVLNKLWRVAYFGFLEEMWDKLYVYVYVTWSRIVKPSISTS